MHKIITSGTVLKKRLKFKNSLICFVNKPWYNFISSYIAHPIFLLSSKSICFCSANFYQPFAFFVDAVPLL